MIYKLKQKEKLGYIYDRIREENLDYITKPLIKKDFKNENLYVYEANNKIKGILSVVYDKEFEYYYIKRLLVFEKGKKIAERMIHEIQNKYHKLAITPFESNKTMIKIVERLGFEFQYLFLEEYCFYTYIKDKS